MGDNSRKHFSTIS